MQDINTVQFTKTLRGDFNDIDVNVYEGLCKATKNIFESIPKDRRVKAYFDIDHVFDSNFENFSMENANKILSIHKISLKDFFSDIE